MVLGLDVSAYASLQRMLGVLETAACSIPDVSVRDLAFTTIDSIDDLLDRYTQDAPVTFGDSIRSKTDEELADWIISHDAKCLTNGYLTRDEYLSLIKREVSK